MKRLNEKEKAVLEYIVRASAEKGYAPSVRDIGQALGYQSTSTVQMYLDRLLSYGILCRENGKSRSLRVRDAAEIVSAIRIPILEGLNIGENGKEEESWNGSLPFAYCGENAAMGELFAYRTENAFFVCRRIGEMQDASNSLNSTWVCSSGNGDVVLTEGMLPLHRVLGCVIARIEIC